MFNVHAMAMRRVSHVYVEHGIPSLRSHAGYCRYLLLRGNHIVVGYVTVTTTQLNEAILRYTLRALFV